MAFNGTWNIIMKTPMGDREVKLTLKQDGENLSGTMESDGSAMDISNGSVKDGRAKWDANITTPMSMKLSFNIAEDGGNLDGTVKLGMFGKRDVTGTPV